MYGVFGPPNIVSISCTHLGLNSPSVESHKRLLCFNWPFSIECEVYGYLIDVYRSEVGNAKVTWWVRAICGWSLSGTECHAFFVLNVYFRLWRRSFVISGLTPWVVCALLRGRLTSQVLACKSSGCLLNAIITLCVYIRDLVFRSSSSSLSETQSILILKQIQFTISISFQLSKPILQSSTWLPGRNPHTYPK